MAEAIVNHFLSLESRRLSAEVEARIFHNPNRSVPDEVGVRETPLTGSAKTADGTGS